MDVIKKISILRQLMKQKNMDAYIIVSDDFHSSEYVGDYFKAREYMSGFTGSAGTLVVMQDNAALWTDGRYFIQADKQLDGSGIELMRIGQDGVLSIPDFLYSRLNDNAAVGFDGRTVSNYFAKQLSESFEPKNISFQYEEDLVDLVWSDRPGISKKPVWELDIKYTGLSRADKLKSVRETMKENGAQVLLLTSLDEIAWLLNLRGDDVKCTPVFLSYMIIHENSAALFVHSEILCDKIINVLKCDGIEIREYNSFYNTLTELTEDVCVWIDSKTANYCALKSLPEGIDVLDKESPVVLMKAVKTPQEMDNIRQAHILDAVAVVRFLYWLKTNVKNGDITELTACRKLEALRLECKSYLGISFDSIIAYGEHGAIVHYEPTEQTDTVMQPRGFCLADVGGHYYEGTTDITRTIALGELTAEEKQAYTLVLKGHLNLANAKFRYGMCGENLDYLARSPLWEYGFDYNHGTGHGVGYLLNVHEGPQSFNWNILRNNSHYVLEEGMVISDEPGLYLEGKFGIRLENLIMVRKGMKNDCGQLMCFENLTMVPFDLDAIDASLLEQKQLDWLNAYHKMVYEKISPYLSKEELDWLRKSTQRI